MALETTLNERLRDCRVLCFDEFHVHDIGDAMLISRLFKALLRRGILLLVTSNYPLCDQPTAVMDYLELYRRFDHWFIDELPNLAECSIAAQQRFINLVDVLYDQDKHLILLGQQSLRERLGGDAIDLARTRSRLGQLVEVREP